MLIHFSHIDVLSSALLPSVNPFRPQLCSALFPNPQDPSSRRILWSAEWEKESGNYGNPWMSKPIHGFYCCSMAHASPGKGKWQGVGKWGEACASRERNKNINKHEVSPTIQESKLTTNYTENNFQNKAIFFLSPHLILNGL